MRNRGPYLSYEFKFIKRYSSIHSSIHPSIPSPKMYLQEGSGVMLGDSPEPFCVYLGASGWRGTSYTDRCEALLPFAVKLGKDGTVRAGNQKRAIYTQGLLNVSPPLSNQYSKHKIALRCFPEYSKLFLFCLFFFLLYTEGKCLFFLDILRAGMYSSYIFDFHIFRYDNLD